MEKITVNKSKRVTNEPQDMDEQKKKQKPKTKNTDFDRMYKEEIEKLNPTKTTKFSEVQAKYELERMKLLNSGIYNKINKKKKRKNLKNNIMYQLAII